MRVFVLCENSEDGTPLAVTTDKRVFDLFSAHQAAVKSLDAAHSGAGISFADRLRRVEAEYEKAKQELGVGGYSYHLVIPVELILVGG
jgi:hypothetical protein